MGYRKRRDGLDSTAPLRWLEAVSLSTTAAAFVVTILLVTTSRATELNSVAVWMLSHGGWAAAGVAAVCVEALGFAYLRRRVDAAPRAARGGGVLLAGVGVVDLAINLRLTAAVGAPPLSEVYVAEYAPAALAVVVAAVVVYLRPDPRPAARAVTRALHPKGRGKAAASLALVALVVLSASIVPFAVITAEPVRAETVLEGFEDGSGVGGFSSTTDAAVGDYAIQGTGASATVDFPQDSYQTVTVLTRANSADNSPRFYPANSGTHPFQVRFAYSSNFIEIYSNGAGNVDTGVDPQAGKWYQLELTLDYSNQDATLRVYNLKGEQLGSKATINSWDNPINSVDSIDISDISGTNSYDHIYSGSAVNLAGPANSLSGTVTDRDGTELRGVDVTVRDSSGTVVATDDTGPDGGYSVGISSAATYTVEYDATGYVPASRTVEISGSVVEDVTLSEGYEQEVTLDDRAGVVDDPRLVVFEYTGSDVRQLEGGPYSQPEVWTSTNSYEFDGNTTTAKLTPGEQYAFRVVDSDDGGNATVVEEWPVEAVDDGEPVTISVAPGLDDGPVSTEKTADGTRVVYDGPAASEFTYQLPNGYNETITFPEPTSYYSTTVGDNVTNSTSDGELEYSGEYANGTSFNGSSIYDSAALSFGPTGGSGGSGGASSGVALGILGLLGAAAYARYGNGEIGRAINSLLP